MAEFRKGLIIVNTGPGKLRRLAGVSEAGARCRNPERSEGATVQLHQLWLTFAKA